MKWLLERAKPTRAEGAELVMFGGLPNSPQRHQHHRHLKTSSLVRDAVQAAQKEEGKKQIASVRREKRRVEKRREEQK